MSTKKKHHKWKEVLPFRDKFYKLGTARPIYKKEIEGIPPVYIGFNDSDERGCHKSYWEIIILGERHRIEGEHWEEESIKEKTMIAVRLKIRLALQANLKVEKLFEKFNGNY